MAVIECVNIKKGNLKRALNYIMNDKKTDTSLIYGKDCFPDTAHNEFLFTKKNYDKENGRQYYHFIQSFNPKDNINSGMAYDIGKDFAEHFKGFQLVMATHKDKEHIHNHFIINSVNFENGYKYQQSKQDLQKLKDFSDKICKNYGLSIIKNKSKEEHIDRNEYRVALKGESWKFKLINAIDYSMEKGNSKNEFIKIMNNLGYTVNWSTNRKYITYSTPTENKCRDNKLHDEKYLKERMELYYGKSKTIKSNISSENTTVGKYTSNRLCNGQTEHTTSRYERRSRQYKENIKFNKHSENGDGTINNSKQANRTLFNERSEFKGRTIDKNKADIFWNRSSNVDDNINNNSLFSEININELSKQAKKELAIKLANATGLKWNVTENKRYKYSSNNIIQSLSDIIKLISNCENNNEQYQSLYNSDFGNNAKREYARQHSYSNEECDLEL